MKILFLLFLMSSYAAAMKLRAAGEKASGNLLTDRTASTPTRSSPIHVTKQNDSVEQENEKYSYISSE